MLYEERFSQHVILVGEVPSSTLKTCDESKLTEKRKRTGIPTTNQEAINDLHPLTKRKSLSSNGASLQVSDILEDKSQIHPGVVDQCKMNSVIFLWTLCFIPIYFGKFLSYWSFACLVCVCFFCIFVLFCLFWNNVHFSWCSVLCPNCRHEKLSD